MKLLLKLLLTFGILIAAIYASSPWWISQVLARQLPPGFQLINMEVAYPGLSGTRVSELSVRGRFQTFELVLDASGIYFNYKDWKTDISAASLDVFLPNGEHDAPDSFSLSDLSLPIARLTGVPPEVSVDELKIALHHGMDFEPGKIVAGEPLVLNLQTIKLVPGNNPSFHLDSTLSIAGAHGVSGQLDMEVSTTSREVDVRFPDSANSQPWLTLSARQVDEDNGGTTTQIQAMLDTGADEQAWMKPLLNPIMTWITDGRLNRIDGKLEAQMLLTGQQQQVFEQLSLSTRNLRVSSDQETLNLDATLLARREGEKVIVSLPAPAEIQYEDQADRINTIIENTVPGLKLQGGRTTLAHVLVNPGSTLDIHPGREPLMAFTGGFKLDVSSPGNSLGLHAMDIYAEATDFPRFDPASLTGRFTAELDQGDALTFTNNELDVKVEELVLSAELIPADGKILSNGTATIKEGHVGSMATSATSVDISWHQLDLPALAGGFKARTRGFRTEIDAETWSGFDFDTEFTLLDNSDIKGAGKVIFDNGVVFPMEFGGDLKTNHWNIILPPNPVKLVHLDGLLSVAHLELPESIKLTGGYINLQGSILVERDISAKLAVEGHDMSASMLESSANRARFSLDTGYASTFSANGPVSIETIKLAGGIDVHEFRADLDMENPETIGLQNLYAEIFDGHLQIGNLQFSDNRVKDTTITLGHINFAHLLAFTDIDGLEGTGFLDFSLPTGSDQDGIYIQNGTFSSGVPGHLAYKKDGVVNSNIGLQALENFQYKTLSGTIDYQSNGAYQIGIHLEGNNPDLYDGHPINFNLNISGSLPELFEALFITGDFEESILKQIGINQPAG